MFRSEFAGKFRLNPELDLLGLDGGYHWSTECTYSRPEVFKSRYGSRFKPAILSTGGSTPSKLILLLFVGATSVAKTCGALRFLRATWRRGSSRGEGGRGGEN